MIRKIVIGDLTISPENGYFIQSIKDLGYKTKYPVASILYLHGVKIGDLFFENKALVVELKIGASTVADLIEKRSKIYEKLTLKEYGDDKITIEFHLGNNLILEAKGVVKDVNSDLVVDNLTTCDLSFTIELEEPFLKSKQVYEVSFGITKGGGASVPMAIPLNMTQGSSGFLPVNNGGNIFSFPEIYFYGNLTNPVLLNKTTGKSISFNQSITSGNYIYVDTYNRIVIDNLGNNKRDKMSGDFVILEKGENQFTLSSDVPTENGYVKFIYKYFYISI
jgi:hypothetical protein